MTTTTMAPMATTDTRNNPQCSDPVSSTSSPSSGLTAAVTDVPAVTPVQPELEQEIVRLKLELAEAKTVNAHTTKERDAFMNELADANQYNARIARERDELRTELKEAARQIDDLTIENTNLRFNSMKLGHDVDVVQQENEELDQRNRYLEGQNDEQGVGQNSSGYLDYTRFMTGSTRSSGSEDAKGSRRGSSISLNSRSSHASSRSIKSRASQMSGARPDFSRMTSRQMSLADIYGAVEEQCLAPPSNAAVGRKRELQRNNSLRSPPNNDKPAASAAGQKMLGIVRSSSKAELKIRS